MPITYVLRDTASDLGGGADFSDQLLETTGALVTQTVSLAKGATETSYGFTPPGEPTSGATGDFTVKVHVTTGNTNVFMSIALSRVSSTGALISGTSAGAEQAMSAGVLTFPYTNLNFGTWNPGDRLRVSYVFRNSIAMSVNSVDVGFNTVDSQVITPFNSASPPVEKVGSDTSALSVSETSVVSEPTETTVLHTTFDAGIEGYGLENNATVSHGTAPAAFQNGGGGLQITQTSGDFSADVTSPFYQLSTYGLVAGDQLKFEYAVRGTSVAIGEQFLAYLEFYDSGSTYISNVFSPASMVANTWVTKLSSEVTIPANATQFNIFLIMLDRPTFDNRVFYLDDVRVLKMLGPAPSAITGSDTGSISVAETASVVSLQNVKKLTVPFNGTVEGFTSNANSVVSYDASFAALKFVQTDGTQNSSIISPFYILADYGLGAGTSIISSHRTRGSFDDGGEVRLEMLFYDSSDTLISNYNYYKVVTADWQDYVEPPYVIPANSTKLRFRYHRLVDEFSVSGKSFWIDEIALSVQEAVAPAGEPIVGSDTGSIGVSDTASVAVSSITSVSASDSLQVGLTYSRSVSIGYLPQILRPNGNGTVSGTWTGTFTDVNEVVPNDANFIASSTNPALTDFYSLTFQDPITPVATGDHVLRFRYAKDADAGREISLDMDIRQGDGTVIAHLNVGLITTTAWTQAEYTLTPAEVANITDYTDLRVRINPTASGGGAGRAAEVSWVEFQVPEQIATDPIFGTEITPLGVTESASVAITVQPKAATLVSNFDNQTGFNGWGADALLETNRLRVNATAAYPGVESAQLYDLNESSIFAELVQTPNVGTGTTQTFLEAVLPDSTKVQIGWTNNSLAFTETISGAQTDTYLGYSATDHKYLRIRHASGVVYWEASADGVSWGTPLRTLSSGKSLHDARIYIKSGFFGTETTPGFALWDNVNVPGAVTVAKVGSESTAISITETANTVIQDSFKSLDPVVGNVQYLDFEDGLNTYPKSTGLTLTNETTQFYSGTRSIRATGDIANPDRWFNVPAATTAPKPFTRYRVSARVWVPSGLVVATDLSNNATDVGPMWLRLGDGTIKIATGINYNLRDQWQYQSVETLTGANPTSWELRFYGASNTGLVWDDILIEESVHSESIGLRTTETTSIFKTFTPAAAHLDHNFEDNLTNYPQDGNAGLTITNVNTLSVSGSRSLLLQNPAGQAVHDRWVKFSPLDGPKSGEEYRLSFSIYIPSTAPLVFDPENLFGVATNTGDTATDTPGKGLVWLRSWSTGQLVKSDIDITKRDEWQRVTINSIPGNPMGNPDSHGPEMWDIRFYGASGDGIYYDDIKLESTTYRDIVSLSVAETSSVVANTVQQNISATDTASLAVAETTARFVTKTASDTTSVSVSETTARFVTRFASDAANLSVAESASIAGQITAKSGSENVSIAVSETAGIAGSVVSITASDTASLAVAETTSGFAATGNGTGGTATIVSGTSGPGTSPATEGIDKLFDGQIGTKWLVFAVGGVNRATATLTLSTAATVTTYEWVTGNDAVGRDPRDWTLQGSNDGTTWTVVDTVVNDPVLNDRIALKPAYTVDTPGSYLYYRWDITYNQVVDNGGDAIQVGELYLNAVGASLVGDTSPLAITETSSIVGSATVPGAETTAVSVVETASIEITTVVTNEVRSASDGLRLAVVEETTIESTGGGAAAISGVSFGGSFGNYSGGVPGVGWGAAVPSAAGQLFVISMVYDNTSATTPTISITKPAGETNNWTILRADSPQAAAGTGAIVSVGYIITTVSWTGFNPGINLTESVAKRAWTGGVFDGVSGTVTSSHITTGATTSSNANAGDFVVTLVGTEENVVPATWSGELQGGTWTFPADAAFASAGQGSNANVALRLGYGVTANAGAVGTGGVATVDSGAVQIVFAPGSGGPKTLIGRSDSGAIGVSETTSIWASEAHAGSDTSAIAVTETTASFRTISVSDAIAVTSTETTASYRTVAVSESTAISVNDNSASFVTLTASDTLSSAVTETGSTVLSSSISVAESTNLTVADTALVSNLLSATDSASISATETATTFRALVSNDGLSIVTTDSSVLTKTIVSTDTASIAVTEVSNVASTLPGTDSVAIGVADVSSVFVTTSGVDATSLSASETASIYSAPSVSDSNSLAVSEAFTLLVVTAATDSANVSVVDNSSLLSFNIVTATDSTAVAVTDTSSTFIAPSATDATALSVVETTQQFNTYVASDTSAVSVADVSSSAIFVSRTDAASLSTAETTAYSRALVASDSGSVAVSDSATVLISAFLPGQDGAAISVAEQAFINVTLTRTETAALSVSETARNAINRTATDATAITVAETRAIQSNILKTASDTSAITVGEARANLVSLSRTDNPSITVNEVTASAITVTRTDTGSIATAENVTTLLSQSRTDTTALSVAESVALTKSLSATETSALTVTETTAMSKDIYATDGSPISLNDSGTMSGDDSIPGSDANQIIVSETTTIQVYVSTNDTPVVSVVEARAISTALAGSDTGTISVTESANASADQFIVVSDTFAISLSESTASVLSLSSNDNATLSVAEATASARGFFVSDNFAVSVSETAANYVTTPASDTLAISVSDTATVHKSLVASDAGGLAVSESTAQFKTVVASDTLPVSLTETVNNNTALPGAETVSLGLAENISILVTQNVFDSTALTVSDARAIAVYRTSTDATALSVAETSALFVDKAASDSAAIALSETFINDTAADEVVGDTLLIGLSESATIYVTQSAADTGALSVLEANAKFVTTVASDSLAVSLTESRAVTVSLDDSDTLTFSVTGTTYTFSNVLISSADESSISVNEVGFVDVRISVSDLLTVGLDESTAQYRSRPGGDNLLIGVTEVVAIHVVSSSDDAIVLSLAENLDVTIPVEALDTAAIGVVEFAEAVGREANTVLVLVRLNDAWVTGTWMEYRGGRWVVGIPHVYRNGEWISI